jgi:hypothetical protein
MTGLAGWLFADLLLVLFITAFATTTTPSAPSTPKATPTPSPRPTQHPKAPKPAPHPAALVLVPYDFTLPVPATGVLNANGGITNGTTAADRLLAHELKVKLARKGLGNRRAGLVEAFGWSPEPSQYATDVAQVAGLSFQKNLPLFSGVHLQSFWTSGSEGSVSLTVFFFATDR